MNAPAGPFDQGETPIEELVARARLDLNDLGNAERLRQISAGRLLWIEESKEWLHFDGTRFTAKGAEAAARAITHEVAHDLVRCVRVVRSIKDGELSRLFGEKFTPEMQEDLCGRLYEWAMRSGNAAQSNAMIAQAKGLPGMCATLDDFDIDPLAYNVLNGVIRFVENGGVWRERFRPGHFPEDRMTRIANVAYDPEAECPNWHGHLLAAQPDDEMRDAMQVLYGYTLTGLIDSQEFYIHRGQGGDGKSLTHDVLATLHGDYFLSSDPEVWLDMGSKRDASGHQSAIHRLRGDIRFVVSDEPPDKSTWSSKRIKQVTGSKVTARGFQEKTEVTFVPRFKLHVECNSLPKSPGDDRGWERRYNEFPWQVQFGAPGFPPIVPPSEMHGKLDPEFSGILNWMIAGALRWLVMKAVPKPRLAVLAKATALIKEQPVAIWMEERADLTDRSVTTSATALWDDFCTWWSGDRKTRDVTRTEFGRYLTKKQLFADKEAKTGLVLRIGIKLAATVGDPL